MSVKHTGFVSFGLSFDPFVSRWNTSLSNWTGDTTSGRRQFNGAINSFNIVWSIHSQSSSSRDSISWREWLFTTLCLHWANIGSTSCLHWAYIGPTSGLHWAYIGSTSGLHRPYLGPTSCSANHCCSFRICDKHKKSVNLIILWLRKMLYVKGIWISSSIAIK